jgi:hypothetical protein
MTEESYEESLARFEAWMNIHCPSHTREDIECSYRAGGISELGYNPNDPDWPYDMWVDEEKDNSKTFALVVVYPSKDDILLKLFGTRRAAVEYCFTQCLGYDAEWLAENASKFSYRRKIDMINKHFEPLGVKSFLEEVTLPA